MFKRLLFCLLPSAFCLLASASDAPLPSADDVNAAVERGQAIRSQKALLPEVLGKNAFVVKIGDVRCGQGLTVLEDAKGEGGAVYKLIEESRSAAPDEEGGVIVDYKGVYLLNAGLGLISANMAWKNTLKDLKAKKDQVHEEKCEFKVDKGELKWTSNVGGQNGNDSVVLKGDAPVPLSVLPMLAIYAERAGGLNKPFCVPALSPLNEQQTFDIVPAWETAEHPKDNAKALKISIVQLLGEFDKHGMELAPANRWTPPQIFVLEGPLLTHLPAPPAPGLSVEPVPADKLDMTVELDLEKIGAAMGGGKQ